MAGDNGIIYFEANFMFKGSAVAMHKANQDCSAISCTLTAQIDDCCTLPVFHILFSVLISEEDSISVLFMFQNSISNH